MNQIPSLQDIELLAADIARNGTAAHASALIELAEAAHAAGMNPGAAEVLTDVDNPEVARLRAFGIIACNWSEIHDAAQQIAFDSAFEALAAQWVEHEDLRQQGDLTQLWDSRTKLAELRAATAAHRPLD